MKETKKELPAAARELQKLNISRVLIFDLQYSTETGESSKKNVSEAYLVSDLIKVILNKVGRGQAIDQLQEIKG